MLCKQAELSRGPHGPTGQCKGMILQVPCIVSQGSTTWDGFVCLPHPCKTTCQTIRHTAAHRHDCHLVQCSATVVFTCINLPKQSAGCAKFAENLLQSHLWGTLTVRGLIGTFHSRRCQGWSQVPGIKAGAQGSRPLGTRCQPPLSCSKSICC